MGANSRTERERRGEGAEEKKEGAEEEGGEEAEAEGAGAGSQHDRRFSSDATLRTRAEE